MNVQQQALRDFWRAKSAFFKSGFGHPTWRRKHHDEGFRITDTCDVERLNRHWARVRVPKVGWVKFRDRTENKAPGRVQDVPAPYTSLRCSACGWIDKKSRKSQAGFVCSSCGFTCNADLNAAINVAAGPRRRDDARKRRASVNQQSGPRGPLLESPSL